MDNLKQLTETVYALEVVGRTRWFGISTNTISYFVNGDYHNKFKLRTNKIPFSFNIICLASQATEEQAKEIVESTHINEVIGNTNPDQYIFYRCYSHDKFVVCSTALESLQSLLTSKECNDGEYLLIRKI